MNLFLDQKRKEVIALCRRAGARRLDAFGSVVRADFDPLRSDLDFLVAFDNEPPAVFAQAYIELKEGLESLFGRPVDLVTESSLANPYFRQRQCAGIQLSQANPICCRRGMGAWRSEIRRSSRS